MDVERIEIAPVKVIGSVLRFLKTDSTTLRGSIVRLGKVVRASASSEARSGREIHGLALVDVLCGLATFDNLFLLSIFPMFTMPSLSDW